MNSSLGWNPFTAFGRKNLVGNGLFMMRLFVAAIFLIHLNVHAAPLGNPHWILFGRFHVQPEQCDAVAAGVAEFLKSDQVLYKNIRFDEVTGHYSKCNTNSEVEYFLNARALNGDGVVELGQYLRTHQNVVVQGHEMRFAQVLSYGVHTKLVFFSHSKKGLKYAPIHKAAVWETFPTLGAVEKMSEERRTIVQSLQWSEFERLGLPVFGSSEIAEYKKVLSQTVMIRIDHEIHFSTRCR
jgi:hypothetical protein